jgi:hypothetical protein
MLRLSLFLKSQCLGIFTVESPYIVFLRLVDVETELSHLLCVCVRERDVG